MNHSRFEYQGRRSFLRLLEGMPVYVTPEGTVYAEIEYGGHKQTCRVGSSVFKRYLVGAYARTEGEIPSNRIIDDAITYVEARAQETRRKGLAYQRVACGAEEITIDVRDEAGSFIIVSASGWRVESHVPINFDRPVSGCSLPIPMRGNHGRTRFREIGKLMGIPVLDGILLAAWVVYCFLPGRSYPPLLIEGSERSLAHCLARLIRKTVDPSSVPLRSIPRDERDLMIAAGGSYLQVFQHFGEVPRRMAEAFRRLTLGTAVGVKKVYQDAEEHVFQYRRPVVLLGPEGTVLPTSIRESAMVIRLPELDDDPGAVEGLVWEIYEDAAPSIFGWLLDAVASSLRTGRRTADGRLLSFEASIEGAAESFECPAGLLTELLEGNREAACEVWLEASPIGPLLAALAPWHGTATELLEELGRQVSKDVRRSKDWPKCPRTLSKELKLVRSSLRGVGVGVRFGKSNGQRVIHLERIDS